MTPTRQTARGGFSLIEVVMAIAIGGLILTAAAGFVFGIFNLNILAEKEPMFEEHVDASTRFLEYAFSSAKVDERSADEDQNNQGGENNNRSNRNQNSNQGDSSKPQGVSWQRIPGESGLNPEALSFRLDGDLPIFVDEDQAFLPEVECWLVFKEKEGLLLRWRTQDMADEEADETFTSVLSPYVNGLTYWYYDREDDKWEDSDEVETADEGGNRMPVFISLSYLHPDGREATRQLLLPDTESDQPLP